MIKSKYFFQDHAELVKEEVEQYEAHAEKQELPDTKCDHMGKVKAVPGGLRCGCGAGWQGPELNVLLDLFNKK